MKVFSIMLVVIFSLGLLGCEEEIKASPSTPPRVIVTKQPVSAQDYYERALSLSYKADWELVITDCSKAIELNPRIYAEAYYLRAIAKIGRKDSKGVGKDFDYNEAGKDFDMSIQSGEEIEPATFKKSIDLAIPPGELVIIDAMHSAEKAGKCIPEKNLPYHITASSRLFTNPIKTIEGKIVLDRYVGDSPALETKKSWNRMGLQTIQFVLTSKTTPESFFACTIFYRDTSGSFDKKSNTISSIIQ